MIAAAVPDAASAATYSGFVREHCAYDDGKAAARVVVRSSELNPLNRLEVSVTNLSANRIADLDRRGVPWKKFYNVNMPPKLPENRGADGLFSAAKWEPLPSGLLGPVTLTPLSVR